MSFRRLRPVTRDLVGSLRGVPDDPSAHLWGLGHGDPLPDWAEASLAAWGMIGVSIHGPDGLGFLLVTPGDALPADHPMRRTPRAPGAAVVVAAYAPSAVHGRDGAERRSGRWLRIDMSTKRHDGSSRGDRGEAVDPFHSVAVGRQLNSFLVGRLHGCVPAVEAGGVGRRSRDPRVAPTVWWEDLGFRLVDPLDAASVCRMQLDLRHTVPSEDLGHRILGWVRGWSSDPVPEPCSAESRRVHRLERVGSH